MFISVLVEQVYKLITVLKITHFKTEVKSKDNFYTDVIDGGLIYI